jgi:hypothetical protein
MLHADTVTIQVYLNIVVLRNTELSKHVNNRQNFYRIVNVTLNVGAW